MNMPVWDKYSEGVQVTAKQRITGTINCWKANQVVGAEKYHNLLVSHGKEIAEIHLPIN